MNLEEKVFNEVQGFIDRYRYKDIKETRNLYIASNLLKLFADSLNSENKEQYQKEAEEVFKFLKKETENE